MLKKIWIFKKKPTILNFFHLLDKVMAKSVVEYPKKVSNVF